MRGVRTSPAPRARLPRFLKPFSQRLGRCNPLTLTLSPKERESGASRLALVALAGLSSLVLVRPAEVWSADNPAVQVHEVTNAERRKAGLPELAASAQLNQAAQTYAQVLAAGSCWAHTCGPVPDLAERVRLAGYTGSAYLGENIASGAPSPQAVLATWLESAPHRANLLNPGYTELGVGVAQSSSQERYWVMVLGARAAPTDSGRAVSSAGTANPVCPSGPPPPPAAAGSASPTRSADHALPNGWFYTQAAGQPDRGFAVTDEAGVAFWSEFQRLGGVAGVGYPISRRFVWDGFPSQAFQKMVFQWRAGEGRVYAVNVIDLLHERGCDNWLRTARATPGSADWTSDTGKPWDEVVAAHQALLTDPDLRAAYFAVSDPVTIYGLPMAPVQNLENVLVLRAQRGILQKWLLDTPWAKAGQVMVANSGDLAKEAGLLPADALVPQPLP